MNFLYLAIFAAAAANALTGFGFGFRSIAAGRSAGPARFGAPTLAMFLSGIAAFALSSYILAPLSLGFLELFLLVPLSVGLSLLADTLLGAKDPGRARALSPVSAYDGLAYLSAFLAARWAVGPLEAAALAAGSASGYLLCAAIADAVRERAEIEAVPRAIRGTPLTLLALGLLALILSFLAVAAYGAFGGR